MFGNTEVALWAILPICRPESPGSQNWHQSFVSLQLSRSQRQLSDFVRELIHSLYAIAVG